MVTISRKFLNRKSDFEAHNLSFRYDNTEGIGLLFEDKYQDKLQRNRNVRQHRPLTAIFQIVPSDKFNDTDRPRRTLIVKQRSIISQCTELGDYKRNFAKNKIKWSIINYPPRLQQT